MCSLCGVRPAMSLSVTTGFFVSHADGLTDGWMDVCHISLATSGMGTVTVVMAKRRYGNDGF